MMSMLPSCDHEFFLHRVVFVSLVWIFCVQGDLLVSRSVCACREDLMYSVFFVLLSVYRCFLATMMSRCRG